MRPVSIGSRRAWPDGKRASTASPRLGLIAGVIPGLAVWSWRRAGPPSRVHGRRNGGEMAAVSGGATPVSAGGNL
jgi:hypothetical protein